MSGNTFKSWVLRSYETGLFACLRQNGVRREVINSPETGRSDMQKGVAKEIRNPGRFRSSNKILFEPILCSRLGRTYNKQSLGFLEILEELGKRQTSCRSSVKAA